MSGIVSSLTLKEKYFHQSLWKVIMAIFLLIMGTFMDALANILILTPLLLPVVKVLGVDPIHFGIVMGRVVMKEQCLFH